MALKPTQKPEEVRPDNQNSLFAFEPEAVTPAKDAPFQSIYVHFESREDIEAFAQLIGQHVTINTDTIWFPELRIDEPR